MLKSLPNFITFSRIAIIPIIVFGIFFDNLIFNNLLFFGYIYSGVTDFFDGYLARKFEADSILGKILDPIADKILVASIMIIIISKNGAFVGAEVAVPFIIILSREFAVAGLREFLSQKQIMLNVTPLAKVKTTMQLFAFAGFIIPQNLVPFFNIIFIDVNIASLIFLWLATIVTIFTGLEYIIKARKEIIKNNA